MAGGTGGHVFPALAVAEEMRGRGWNVVWLGAEGGMETTLVPQHGFAMETIRFRGVRGKGLLRWALLPLALLVAFWQSARVIFRVRPDVVLGMGGFAAFPGGMMASFLNRPFAIHEQNAIPGLANRVLAQVADRVYAAFPEALRKSRWSGNPVRAEIAAVASPAERFAGRAGPLRLFVVGGSLGAQSLNAAVPRALALLPEAERPTVTHQAGMKHIDALKQHYAEAGVGGELVPFVDDMARRYEETDLVVIIGEIGGDDEERAAAFIAERVTKPVVSYIAGFTAPAGKRMGHAGAIITGSSGTAAAKAEALEAAGVGVGRTPTEVAELVRAALP